MKKNKTLNSEIILQTLKRSSLKTVLVEGDDDIEFYRKFEDELSHLGIDFLQCGGRSTLLEIYKRKSELNNSVLFICDADLWLFLGHPEFIKDQIIVTSGYSIENEIFQDGKDILMTFFEKVEIERFEKIIKSISEWYTFEVGKVINDNAYDCKFADVTILNTEVIAPKGNELLPAFLEKRNFIKCDDELLKKNIDNYARNLRGKFIFQALEKIFQARNKKGVGYSKQQLFDIVYNFTVKSDIQDAILVNRKKQIEMHFA